MIEKIIIVALGGNAILSNDASVNAQKNAIRMICKKLVKLIENRNKLVISHGNGPQVGNILLQQEAADSIRNPRMPLDTCVAMTQGSIGYWIQNEMSKILKQKDLNEKVVSLITQVSVDINDEAFSNPTKPIGPFLTKEEANSCSLTDSCVYGEDSGRGYRKLVASPKPVEIIEADIIKNLINNGFITVSCGGGGIPVVDTNDGYEGIEAVIDKDLASEKLAEQVNADVFILLTGVDNVYINYNKPDQQKLGKVKLEDVKTFIKENQFEKGSMLPKIQAAVEFVESSTSRVAIITSLSNLDNIDKEVGTIISR